jgi:hemerythrin superfamily protein
MNIYQRLKQDHTKQRELGKKILKTSGDSDQRNTLFAEYKAELTGHASAEEQTLYAALIEKPDGQEQAQHSVSEHKQLADLIEDLENTYMAHGAWLQKFEKLDHEVVHHVDEEEDDVFPLAKKLIDDEKAEHLADKFEKRKAMQSSD